MAVYNIQQIQIREDIDEVINLSIQRWLNAEEMHVLFTYRNHIPLSQATHIDGPGLYRLRCFQFRDAHHQWHMDVNGRRTRSRVLRHEGETWFNYTVAFSPQLVRRNIRYDRFYGNETFVHYRIIQ